MPRPEAHLLQDFLTKTRRVVRVRGLTSLALDASLVVGGFGAAMVGIAGLSLRGDLVTPVGLILASASLGALVARRSRRLHGQTHSRLALARTIAASDGPLREVATERELERDAILRHEILGATELWTALEGDEAELTTSTELAAAYVHRIGATTVELAPTLAVAKPRYAARLVGALALAGAALGLAATDVGQLGASLALARADGRPPKPPEPVWASLELVLDYPAHTRRSARRVPNPSGGLRVPAGTRIRIELDALGEPEALRLVSTHDPSGVGPTPPPEVVDFRADPARAGHWSAELEVRGPGSWVIASFDEADEADSIEDIAVATRRSEPLPIEIEPDAPPEIELLPLPRDQREASETDRVDIRFTARDDFGLAEAELVYELLTAEGEVERHRLPAGSAPGEGARSWRHRYAWDLSAIPVESRGAVSYWIEIRDNDPGLGLAPLPEGPGKITASARQQLLVHDREAEHAQNIHDLQAIRDAAVDLLAARLTTHAFDGFDDDLLELRALRRARELHTGSVELLAMLAAAVDALALDTLVDPREVETLAGIHARLLELHRSETELLDSVPVDAEFDRLDSLGPLMAKLGVHNGKQREQLEDEIIRLDDLVDGEIIAHIETLVSRLQVSQQKLVEKLEQLAAGDESVRSEIEQLEQRIRADLQRIQQAKAQLRKEVGEEWMNLDAFKSMEARMRSQELLEQLRKGDVEGALDQAREQLDAIKQLREQVQRSGAETETPALSEEDRQRMKMLRELSRLQDDETSIRKQTTRLREQWRDAVGEREAGEDARAQAQRDAERMTEDLDAIDDSNLSREGRAAWDDAREAYEALEAAAEREGASALELQEAARAAAQALERAADGAKADEAEGRALDKLARKARALERELREPLPTPDEVLDPEAIDELNELAEAQRALRKRAEELLEDPDASILPEPGRAAMRRADRGMRDAGDGLEDATLDEALDGSSQAWGGFQRAIDSLRQSAPPPPPPSAASDASTEAERDRSLRDQVVDAMREGDRDDFDEDTKRYYEELLR